MGIPEVSVPARLLMNLIWAAECLAAEHPEEDDMEMLTEAKHLLAEQSPGAYSVLQRIDSWFDHLAENRKN